MKCCNNKIKKEGRGGLRDGLIYGLIPHIGCLGFIIFAIFGVTAATALFKPLLLNPYFFHILIGISLIFATISAFFYLKKQGIITLNRSQDGLELSFSLQEIKRKWKYLFTLYGATMAVNLMLFMVIFPVLATLDAEEKISPASIINVFIGREDNTKNLLPSVTLEVAIPCPGHAPLITGELRTIDGVEDIQYRFPNKFIVNYNPQTTSKDQILALDVFNIYKAILVER